MLRSNSQAARSLTRLLCNDTSAPLFPKSFNSKCNQDLLHLQACWNMKVYLLCTQHGLVNGYYMYACLSDLLDACLSDLSDACLSDLSDCCSKQETVDKDGDKQPEDTQLTRKWKTISNSLLMYVKRRSNSLKVVSLRTRHGCMQFLSK